MATFERAKLQWALRREGCSLAHVENVSGWDEVHDKIMLEDLEQHRQSRRRLS